MTTLIDFASKEARDAAAAIGMTDGVEQSWQLLSTPSAMTTTSATSATSQSEAP